MLFASGTSKPGGVSIWTVLFYRICITGVILVCGNASGQHDCGFSAFRPAGISHFDKSAVNRVLPESPAIAKNYLWNGTVQIRVLVDVAGKVVRTCPVYVPGKPVPHLSLIATASAAAKQWTFTPNFSFGPEVHPNFRYVQEILVFRFVPPDQRKEIAVERERFNPADLDGFTTPSTERKIIPLETMFLVDRVEGVIVSKGDGLPIEAALFEVRGPSEDHTVTRNYTDRNGRFQLNSLRPGDYLFKTTVKGYEAVLGSLLVGTVAQPQTIRIELTAGTEPDQ